MLKIVKISQVNYVILSPEREKKLAALKNEKARLLSLAAEKAYNEVCTELCGRIVPYHYAPSGKPENGEFFFSLSHSGEYALCAAKKSPVGADIQIMRRADIRLAKRFFSQDEFEYIKNGKNKEEAFFEIWTMKEAYVKAKGGSIGEDFKKFSVFSLKGWELRLLELIQGYKLCVCTKLPDKSL